MARLDRATRSGTEDGGNLLITTRSFGVILSYRTGPGGPVDPPIKSGEDHDVAGESQRSRQLVLQRHVDNPRLRVFLDSLLAVLPADA